MKLDLKRKHKNIYKAGSPAIIFTPEAKYISISGEGSPDSELFKKSIESLYGIAYTISMSYKGAMSIPNFENFVVPPLEGEWTTRDNKDYTGNKEQLKWDIMLMMPNFVTDDVFKLASNIAYKKKKTELIKSVKLIKQNSKEVCVALHVGLFADEHKTFQLMQKHVDASKYKRSSFNHKEIYLSDFRKVDPNKMKTVLMFDVKNTLIVKK